MADELPDANLEELEYFGFDYSDYEPTDDDFAWLAACGAGDYDPFAFDEFDDERAAVEREPTPAQAEAPAESSAADELPDAKLAAATPAEHSVSTLRELFAEAKAALARVQSHDPDWDVGAEYDQHAATLIPDALRKTVAAGSPTGKRPERPTRRAGDRAPKHRRQRPADYHAAAADRSPAPPSRLQAATDNAATRPQRHARPRRYPISASLALALLARQPARAPPPHRQHPERRPA